MREETSTSWDYDALSGEAGEMTIRIRGRMDASNASSMMQQLIDLLDERKPRSLTMDLGGVDYLDDFGVLVLVELRNHLVRTQGRFQLENIRDRARETLSLLRFEEMAEGIRFEKKPQPGMFVRLGEAAIRHAGDLKYQASFLGSVVLALLHVCLHPRSLRREDTILCMQKTGVDALPIVALISFLLGLIMAFMSSVQLRQFGANIYVASLVSLSMVRELGPIMTAIIVAGRSGSAFASEIGTMKISDEVDALFTMGLDPARFLVVPKLIASVIVVPFLTLFSDLFAIMGGLMVGVSMLDLTVGGYMTQTLWTLEVFDVAWGFMKSAVFAVLIAWIGCLRGFQVRGGAAGVGRATTSAVVSSLFLIILTDSIFAVILRYWG